MFHYPKDPSFLLNTHLTHKQLTQHRGATIRKRLAGTSLDVPWGVRQIQDQASTKGAERESAVSMSLICPLKMAAHHPSAGFP